MHTSDVQCLRRPFYPLVIDLWKDWYGVVVVNETGALHFHWDTRWGWIRILGLTSSSKLAD